MNLTDILKSLPNNILEEYEKLFEEVKNKKGLIEEKKGISKRKPLTFLVGATHVNEGWAVIMLSGGDEKGRGRWCDTEFMKVVGRKKLQRIEKFLWNRIRIYGG